MQARKDPSKAQHQDVLSFLTEFARLLLAAGFSSSQFNQMAELAFFRAASEDARFRNTRINQSSVAAMTGLNRARIRVLMRAEKKKSHPQPESRRQRLLTAWLSEPEFLTSMGEPRRLKLGGTKASFSTLARRYGGDVTPQALLRDFVRRGLVQVSRDHVHLASNAKEVKDIRRIEQISAALCHALSAPAGTSPRRTMRVASFDITHPAPGAVGRILLQRRISKSLKGFMAELDAICSAITIEPSANRPNTRRMGKTSVFLLNQD